MFCDEAHHLENPNSKVMSKINQLQYERIIKVSATFHDQANLDYNYPMRDAINDGYISDYVLHIEYFSDGDKLAPLAKMVRENPSWGPILIYFNNTERCIGFNVLLREVGVKSDYIIGDTSTIKRAQIKESVKSNQTDVVCLCGCWNEGESIDNIQTVIFGDLRHSQINKIQIAMRANRLFNDKPFYRVVIPLQDNDFKNTDIRDIINTFAEIDPCIEEAIKTRSCTRIKISDNRNEDEVAEKASELWYEEIYSRMGELISSTWDLKIWDISGVL